MRTRFVAHHGASPRVTPKTSRRISRRSASSTSCHTRGPDDEAPVRSLRRCHPRSGSRRAYGRAVAASEGLRTLVVEALAPGGQAGTSARIENYPGFPDGVSGSELAANIHAQASRLGAEVLVGVELVTRCPATA